VKILTVGINHKTSSIESREKFFLTTTERELLLSAFKNDPSVIAALILSTCNRCEIYANVDEDYQPREILNKLFSIKHQPQTDELQSLFYVLEGQEAVTHLLRVACGLDSLILGEKQILGQIKEAVLLSRQHAMMDKTFNILTNLGLETAKKARRETHIDFGGSSVSWASVMMAQKILGSLQDKTVLILGSGKMGRLAVEQLINKGVKKIYIMNRTIEKAQELANQSGGTAVPFWEMADILPQADVCICSSSCPHYLVDQDLVEKTMRLRVGKRLVCIDISMPRNIDPKVADIKGVTLVTVDDLDRVVQDNIQKRLCAAEEVEMIVLNKVREFYEVINKIRAIETKETLNLSAPLMILLVTVFILWAQPAHAGLDQIKAYKEAYPDSKPKCIDCHVDKIPKKDDGAHELNEYGKAVVKAAGTDKPTADTYKKAGPIPPTKSK
jgi:glutamyl-tRNA reductase